MIIIVVLGVFGYIYQTNKSSNDDDKTNTDASQLDNEILDEGKPPQEVTSIINIKQLYSEQKYEEVITSALSLYKNQDNPRDFRLSALGYCVRSLNVLKRDTGECQNEADTIINETTGDYKLYLQSIFSGESESAQ